MIITDQVCVKRYISLDKEVWLHFGSHPVVDPLFGDLKKVFLNTVR